ncbi:(Na+)-NQR maturation NqrM [Phytopseudomonas dryadis]|uniref:ApbE family protein n=1 Tax=Phytopseudomonas dryadis TaxID=2487520 RepID=A0ABY1ZBI9_9GAMM|nr:MULTISPECIES: (Na+)-NQR maturation NqrM [Pseudomonas]TBV07128.1 ApbE family protein [Pseudomonas dryadis]TBV19478.1 ApbE family protein [Pseudomonas sp. FRB 230]
MTFVMVFLIMLTVVGLMAVGVMMGRKPIAGSCGGIASLGIEKECSICGGDREVCEEVTREAEGKGAPGVQTFDASKR